MQESHESSVYPVRLRRKRDVCEMTTLPPSTLDDYVRQGIFPSPMYLGGSDSKKNRIPVWKESTVLQWIENLPSK